MSSNLKQIILDRIVALVRGSPFLEQILCYCCAHPFPRNQLKLGAIAYHYLSSLDRPELRIARLNGYQMWVNIAEYQGLFLYFFREHQEPQSARLASELIQEGDICIDVGANMGSYTFLMASQVGDRGKVFAFEPQPNLYQMLVDSIQLNRFQDRAIADSRVLSSQSGEKLKFYLSQDARNSGMASTICQGNFLQENRFIEVETITLADYFQERAIDSCHLLKVDVECAELAVFKGMLSLFQEQRVDYLIVEQAASGESQKLLLSLGYTGWFIDESKNQHPLIDLDKVPQGCFGNYFFVSPRHLENFKSRYSHWIESCTNTNP